MQNAAAIIDALGGTAEVARALKLTASTVSSWKFSKTGAIPAWRVPAILKLAKKRGVDLSALPSRAA